MNCPHGHPNGEGCKPCDSFVLRTFPRSMKLCKELAPLVAPHPEIQRRVRDLTMVMCEEIMAWQERAYCDTRLSVASLLEFVVTGGAKGKPQ